MLSYINPFVAINQTFNGHYNPNLANWFRNGISGKKLAVVGDSTSDNSAAAAQGVIGD